MLQSDGARKISSHTRRANYWHYLEVKLKVSAPKMWLISHLHRTMLCVHNYSKFGRSELKYSIKYNVLFLMNSLLTCKKIEILYYFVFKTLRSLAFKLFQSSGFRFIVQSHLFLAMMPHSLINSQLTD